MDLRKSYFEKSLEKNIKSYCVAMTEASVKNNCALYQTFIHCIPIW